MINKLTTIEVTYKSAKGISFMMCLCILMASCQYNPADHTVTLSYSDKYYEPLIKDSLEYNTIIFQKNSTDTFQLLLLLHGHGGDHQDWFEQKEGNIEVLLKSQLGRLKCNVIGVSLNASNSWYIDRHIPMESIIMNSFIPMLVREHKNKVLNERLWMAGNSAGGYGALRLGLKYPESFSAILLLSPAAYQPLPPDISSSRRIDVFADANGFNDSIWTAYNYPSIEINNDLNYPDFYVTSGIEDTYGTYQVIQQLAAHFDLHGISFDSLAIHGGHDWKTWRKLFTIWIENYTES